MVAASFKKQGKPTNTLLANAAVLNVKSSGTYNCALKTIIPT
jgi:hypothetical protein